MANNKVKFLKILLDDPKLTDAHYSRIEELLSKASSNNEKRGKVSPNHHPKDTFEFLCLFTANEGGLKSLTHPFDFGSYIDYSDLISACRNEFNEACNRLIIPKELYSRIYQYAFEKNPKWYIRVGNSKSDKVEYTTGWSSPEFIKWYKENREHPYNDPDWRSRMIDPFKNSIQIRPDSKNLVKILELLASNKAINNLEIIIDESITKAEFFTNVDMLAQAIANIFETISEHATRNFQTKVLVKYEEHKLYIIHIDSKPSKNVENNHFAGGSLNGIINNLRSLCNYYIEAEFENGKFRKFLLYDTIKQVDYEKLDDNYSLLGFTHILKFY